MLRSVRSEREANKYRRVKRRYRDLAAESHYIADELVRAHRHIRRLERERDFLLDKLVKSDPQEAAAAAAEASMDFAAAAANAEAEAIALATSAAVNSATAAVSSVAVSASDDTNASAESEFVTSYGEVPHMDSQVVGVAEPRESHHEAVAAEPAKYDVTATTTTTTATATTTAAATTATQQQTCAAVGRDGVTRCKGRALAGLAYCWHHSPLDPNSGYVYCQYSGGRGAKQQRCCLVPVPKDRPYPYCSAHLKAMVPESLAASPMHHHHHHHHHGSGSGDDRGNQHQQEQQGQQRHSPDHHQQQQQQQPAMQLTMPLQMPMAMPMAMPMQMPQTQVQQQEVGVPTEDMLMFSHQGTMMVEGQQHQFADSNAAIIEPRGMLNF